MKNILESEFNSNILTRWYLKKVTRLMQPMPMWLNIVLILLMEPPANNVAIDSNKFPAGILVLAMKGWLHHLNSYPHSGLQQEAFTSTIVPICLVITRGLSALQAKQILNSNNNFDKKTICLASWRMFPSTVNVQLKGRKIQQNDCRVLYA